MLTIIESNLADINNNRFSEHRASLTSSNKWSLLNEIDVSQSERMITS